MKEKIFTKKNVFTFVMFGAILAFAIYQSVFPKEDIAVISFLIAIPTFVLSIFKITTDILEDINDKITTFLDKSLDTCSLEENNIYWKLCDERCEAESIIQEYYNSEGDNYRADYMKDKFLQCYKARRLRRRVRRFRRGLLYIYYFVFLLMIIALFLHAELAQVISNGPLKSINLNLITLWSLIIVLIEIMLKEIIEEAILHILNKRIGGYGEWC